MAAVQQNNDYNFDMFDVHTRVHGNAAPARTAPAKTPKEKAPLKVVSTPKTRVQTKKEARSATANSLLIAVFAAVLLAMLCLHVNAGVILQTDRRISRPPRAKTCA